MNPTPNLRIFFYVVSGLFLINLLVMNEVTTIWDGAETRFVWEALYGSPPIRLPQLIARWVSGGSLAEFSLRLPGVLMMIAGIAGFYYIAGPLIGRPAAQWTLVVMASSLLLPELGKVATVDSWSFAVQLLATVLIIRFVKQPRPGWRWLTYGMLTLSVWIDPLKSALYFTFFPVFLGLAHPQGRAVWRLQPWLVPLLAGGIGWWSGWLLPSVPVSFFGFHLGRFLLAVFIGVLPFLGFWLAGLWDTWAKARRGEELAIINAAWIAAALISQSLVLGAVFSLLIAKQLLLYFDAAYPLRNVVKTGSVLHLIGAFFLAMILMLYGFVQFGGPGFRAALLVGGGYWVLSLVGAIGLYGQNRRLLWGGVVGTGLVVTLFFWLQFNPLLNSRRDLPKRLAAEMTLRRKKADTPVVLVQPGDSSLITNEMLYLRSDLTAFSRYLQAGGIPPGTSAVVAAPWNKPDSLSVGRDSTLIRGWNDRLQPEAWVLWGGR